MGHSISVILVNYNGVKHLRECLDSLLAQTYKDFEIVLVDNASTDGSSQLVVTKYPSVRSIQSESNVGFSAGNNIGIRETTGKFIATLNTDTRAEPDYLEKLVAPMQHERVGACAPLMLEMERPPVVDAAGITVDSFGFAWNIGAGEPASKFSAPREVYGACAGAALYRRELLEQIGGFDDAYFGFYEDADVAWRAHKLGWKTEFVPLARVYHHHGASFGKISEHKTYLLARNRWWTTFKNYPMPQLAVAFPFILALDGLSLVQAALRGHGKQAWQGRVDAWRTRDMMWQKRSRQ
jgi:GT2 family glycosyltransferase